jgi:hypothetical protein
MGCCGQRRAATTASLRQTNENQRQAPRTRPTLASQRTPSRPKTVALRYLGSKPVTARGTATGRRYAFTQRGAIVPVDTQDVAPLVRSGLFARD